MLYFLLCKNKLHIRSNSIYCSLYSSKRNFHELRIYQRSNGPYVDCMWYVVLHCLVLCGAVWYFLVVLCSVILGGVCVCVCLSAHLCNYNRNIAFSSENLVLRQPQKLNSSTFI